MAQRRYDWETIRKAGEASGMVFNEQAADVADEEFFDLGLSSAQVLGVMDLWMRAATGMVTGQPVKRRGET